MVFLMVASINQLAIAVASEVSIESSRPVPLVPNLGYLIGSRVTLTRLMSVRREFHSTHLPCEDGEGF